MIIANSIYRVDKLEFKLKEVLKSKKGKRAIIDKYYVKKRILITET